MSIQKDNARVEEVAQRGGLQEDMKVSERNKQRIQELKKNIGGGDTAQAVQEASRMRDLPDKGKYINVVA